MAKKTRVAVPAASATSPEYVIQGANPVDNILLLSSSLVPMLYPTTGANKAVY